jgi:hypothetical protein
MGVRPADLPAEHQGIQNLTSVDLAMARAMVVAAVAVVVEVVVVLNNLIPRLSCPFCLDDG